MKATARMDAWIDKLITKYPHLYKSSMIDAFFSLQVVTPAESLHMAVPL